MISKKERGKDRAICEAATPPPWHRLGCLTMDSCVESDATRDCMPRMTADIDGSVAGDVEARANADLIARAREALPAYIADAEEMERRIDAVESMADTIRGAIPHVRDMGEHGEADALAVVDKALRKALGILRGES